MVDDLSGKLIAEKYRIESMIGEGDAGDLFAAQNEITDTAVTVKILPQALAMDMRWAKRFIDESRAASTVNHENILNLTDFGSDIKGICYAVFEPIEGTQLSELLTTSLDEGRSIRIAKQVAAAVSAAHAKKLVHGRISPQTIFVKTDDSGIDHVKIYGFGGDPLNVERDADPRYLAPEQSTAYPVADDRTDVYSLGITLYEMLSGVLPFEGKTAADVLAKAANEPPPPLSAFRKDLNPEIEPIILTAMASNADRRYQTMAAFAEDLELLANRIGPAKAAAVAAAGAGRSVWKTASIAFAGIAILAVALIFATSTRQTDPTEQLVADAGNFPVHPLSPASGRDETENLRAGEPTKDQLAAFLTRESGLLDDLPGGDGFNAWGNNGIPPLGNPNGSGIPPLGPVDQSVVVPTQIGEGGRTISVPPAGSGSQFMPVEENGVILVAQPTPKGEAEKPNEPTDKKVDGPQTKPNPATAKPLATPPTKPKPATKNREPERPNQIPPVNKKRQEDEGN